jgi:AraC-like DNA-binding protein
MDVLSDIFGVSGLRGAFYFRSEFSPPWSIQVPPFRAAARFHYVVSGAANLTLLRSRRELPLREGDFALIPFGAPHIMADAPGRTPAPLEEVLQRAGHSGDGVLVMGEGDATAVTRTVCGHFDFRDGADHPLLRALPECIILSAAERAAVPFLEEALQMLVSQVFKMRAGSVATIIRLSEVLFIETLRSGMAQAPALAEVLTAFDDPAIGRALVLMHEYPARPWTVEALAREVGVSRSRFAERFQALLGVGPMGYLANWRMQRALALLDETDASIGEVARRTGYLSAAAFTRAFARVFGRAPSAARRRPEQDGRRDFPRRGGTLQRSEPDNNLR